MTRDGTPENEVFGFCSIRFTSLVFTALASFSFHPLCAQIQTRKKLQMRLSRMTLQIPAFSFLELILMRWQGFLRAF